MVDRGLKERCTWRVTRADGALLAEGSFFETHYEAALARAKHDASAFALPGATLTLEVGRMAIMTFRY